MVLSERLRAFAASRPHLLLVEAPGGAATRLTVERVARERGWRLVETPADADVLVVAGAAGGLSVEVERVWDQLPGPRSRVELSPGDDVLHALDGARAALLGTAAQAEVRRTDRPPAGMPPGMAMDGMDMGGHDMGGMDMGSHDMGDQETPAPDPHAGHDMSSGEEAEAAAPDPHAGHDMGGHDMGGQETPAPDPHAGHDMGGHDMGGMAGMDMGGHDMGGMSGHEGHDMGGMDLPAGLAMADRAPDRDGLKLDVLTVPWGPVLPWWPAGLVLTTVLQGDVVQSVDVDLRGSAEERRAGWAAALAQLDRPTAAVVVRLDALVRLLGVAGWEGARLRCQRARDALLTGGPAGDLPRIARRISASRSLARSTAGVPSTGGEDLTARYRRWLQEAVTAYEHGTVPPPADEPHVLHALPGLLTGTDVGGLRLVVAGLDLALSGADAPVGAGV